MEIQKTLDDAPISCQDDEYHLKHEQMDIDSSSSSTAVNSNAGGHAPLSAPLVAAKIHLKRRLPSSFLLLPNPCQEPRPKKSDNLFLPRKKILRRSRFGPSSAAVGPPPAPPSNNLQTPNGPSTAGPTHHDQYLTHHANDQHSATNPELKILPHVRPPFPGPSPSAAKSNSKKETKNTTVPTTALSGSSSTSTDAMIKKLKEIRLESKNDPCRQGDRSSSR